MCIKSIIFTMSQFYRIKVDADCLDWTLVEPVARLFKEEKNKIELWLIKSLCKFM